MGRFEVRRITDGNRRRRKLQELKQELRNHVAKELGAGKRVVTVIPDSAERYLSKGLLD